MIHLEQSQTQSQVLAPQLRQSLKILQASAMDLKAFVQEELTNNPTLEEIPGSSSKESTDSIANEAEWNSNYANDASEASQRHDFLLNSLQSEVSLQSHLQEQVGCLDLTKKLKELVLFIIGSLNQKGFLDSSIDELMRQTGCDYDTLMHALSIVQQLDPVGVGCFDIPSSLMAQLTYQQKGHSLAFKIISQCYPLLLHNKLNDIARACSASLKDVQAAIRNDIAPLNPAPGSAYAHCPSPIIIPDVKIYKNPSNEWIVELNHTYIPQLRIGSNYKDLLAQNIDANDRRYLQIKMRSGRFLIQAILQRQKTIERISQAILQYQQEFFNHGVAYLKPLTLQTVAEFLNLHETTISRATANKYVDTPFGVFRFKYFFTKGLARHNTDERISNAVIKQEMRKLIDHEDKQHPLSDQAMVELFKNKQIQIARRTITKYRKQLGILPVHMRRQYSAY